MDSEPICIKVEVVKEEISSEWNSLENEDGPINQTENINLSRPSDEPQDLEEHHLKAKSIQEVSNSTNLIESRESSEERKIKNRERARKRRQNLSDEQVELLRKKRRLRYEAQLLKKDIATDNVKVKKQVPNSTKVTCQHCNKTFEATFAVFAAHVKKCASKKLDKSTCDICGVKYSTAAYLDSHKAAVHFKSKQFKCHLCDKVFPLGRYLSFHQNTVHLGVRFKCILPGCGKAYTTKAGLRVHLKTNHDNQLSSSHTPKHVNFGVGKGNSSEKNIINRERRKEGHIAVMTNVQSTTHGMEKQAVPGKILQEFKEPFLISTEPVFLCKMEQPEYNMAGETEEQITTDETFICGI